MKINKLYKDKDWLENQYVNLNKSTPEIGKICGVEPSTILFWLKKFSIPRRSHSESLKGKNIWIKGKKQSEEHKRKKAEAIKGERHGNWKGKFVKYSGLHAWIERHKSKPNNCEICKKSKRLELSNKDHKYSRNLTEWQWVCRSCHTKFDIEKGLRRNPIDNLKKGISCEN